MIRTTELRDAELIHLAAQRATVTLRDGTTSRLVRWRGVKHPGTARVEFANGRHYTVRAAHVWSVQLPTTTTEEQ